MMKATEIKNTLHKAIDAADEQMLAVKLNELFLTKPANRGKKQTAAKAEDIILIFNEMLELYRFRDLFYETAENKKTNTGNDFTLPGKPMTKKDFQKRIDNAIKSANEGNTISHEDLKIEMQSW